ncbi:DgyrCDS2219 [Dimorphilus gyrociliatus]|uniref:DgyrCDS2219 n=1 Tax=Dimorphilus gyrociliatus TaxID=2664684 RepID=A0A7I8VBF3_9ANNE|nr:DgyrCDS2219 [Dimorphilus gyrociliatus]
MEEADEQTNDVVDSMETSDKLDSYSTNRALDAFRSIYETAIMDFDAKSAEERFSKANDLLRPLIPESIRQFLMRSFLVHPETSYLMFKKGLSKQDFKQYLNIQCNNIQPYQKTDFCNSFIKYIELPKNFEDNDSYVTALISFGKRLSDAMFLHYSNPVIQESTEMKRKIAQQSSKYRRTSRRIRNKRVITPPLTSSSPSVKRKGLSKGQCLSLMNLQLKMVIEKFNINDKARKSRLDIKLIRAFNDCPHLFHIDGKFPENKELVCNSASFAVALDMINLAIGYKINFNETILISPSYESQEDFMNLGFMQELRQVLNAKQQIFFTSTKSQIFDPNSDSENITEEQLEDRYQSLRSSFFDSIAGGSEKTNFRLSEDERKFLHHLCCSRNTVTDFIRACNKPLSSRPKILKDSPFKSCLDALPVLQYHVSQMNQILPLVQNTEVTRNFLGVKDIILPQHQFEIDLISESSKSKLQEILGMLSKRKPKNITSLINKTMQKVLETSIAEDSSRTVLSYQFENTLIKNRKYIIRNDKVFICHHGGLISLLNTCYMTKKEQMEGILKALKRKENSWLFRRYHLQQSSAKFENDDALQIRNGIAYFRIRDKFYFLDSKEKMSIRIQCVCFLKAINEEQNERILFGPHKIDIIHSSSPYLSNDTVCVQRNNHIYLKRSDDSYYMTSANLENIMALKRIFIRLKDKKSSSISYHRLSNTPTQRAENIIVKENQVYMRIEKDIYASLKSTNLNVVDQKRKLKQLKPNIQLDYFERDLKEENMLMVNKNLDKVKTFKNPKVALYTPQSKNQKPEKERNFSQKIIKVSAERRKSRSGIKHLLDALQVDMMDRQSYHPVNPKVLRDQLERLGILFNEDLNAVFQEFALESSNVPLHNFIREAVKLADDTTFLKQLDKDMKYEGAKKMPKEQMIMNRIIRNVPPIVPEQKLQILASPKNKIINTKMSIVENRNSNDMKRKQMDKESPVKVFVVPSTSSDILHKPKITIQAPIGMTNVINKPIIRTSFEKNTTPLSPANSQIRQRCKPVSGIGQPIIRSPASYVLKMPPASTMPNQINTPPEIKQRKRGRPVKKDPETWKDAAIKFINNVIRVIDTSDKSEGMVADFNKQCLEIRSNLQEGTITSLDKFQTETSELIKLSTNLKQSSRTSINRIHNQYQNEVKPFVPLQK